MKKVEDYTLVIHFGADKLVKAVNEQIKAGWQPLGGITLIERDDINGVAGVVFAQAMVK